MGHNEPATQAGRTLLDRHGVCDCPEYQKPYIEANNRHAPGCDVDPDLPESILAIEAEAAVHHHGTEICGDCAVLGRLIEAPWREALERCRHLIWDDWTEADAGGNGLITRSEVEALLAKGEK